MNKTKLCEFLNKRKASGISLRTTSVVTLAAIVCVTVFLFAVTVESARVFSQLSNATDEHITMQESASALIAASDYLTQEVQRFTLTHDMENMDNYFTEANVTKRREKAIDILSKLAEGTDALHHLQTSMNESLALMEREYYAMLLVLEATDNDYRPAELEQLSLTPGDEALSTDKKIQLAQTMVHDRIYYDKKFIIRTNLDKCLEDLDEIIKQEQDITSDRIDKCLNRIRLMAIIQLLTVLLGLYLLHRLGTAPLIKCVQQIKNDEPIRVIGSTEFRYLAATYNKMHNAVKESLSLLNYRASHDKLTGVYNRAGYEIISTSIKLENTIMILIDVDDFKGINDTHGHIVGDKILQKIASTLSGAFRSFDYVCRIGGDEFVIFLINTEYGSKEVILDKLKSINDVLADASDGLPSTSISAGCVCGAADITAQKMLQLADIALYKAKKNGKKGAYFA